MGRKRDYQAGLFDELEKLNKKLDKLIKENKEQSLTIYNLNLTIKDLNKQLNQAKELNQKLIEENEKLKNQNNKNSNNSSKPSSTNIVTPKKKTGANLYNYRVKTGKSIGGQYGHKGYNLDKKKIEELIDENKIELRTITHVIKGDSKKQPVVKYRVELEIRPYVEKHIFKYNEKAKEKMSAEFYTDVTYGNSIKTLSIHLGCYNVIAYDRLSDFFRVVSNNVLNISNGTLVNFVNEFGRKSEKTIKVLENNFLNGTKGFTDETGTKC